MGGCIKTLVYFSLAAEEKESKQQAGDFFEARPKMAGKSATARGEHAARRAALSPSRFLKVYSGGQINLNSSRHFHPTMSYQFSATTSLSDETYLEAFVESISATVPNEMRRNLEHLRDLDNAGCKLIEEWRDRQDECLKGVEESLLKVFRGEVCDNPTAATANSGISIGGDGSPTQTPEGELVIASDEKRGAKRKQPQERSSE